MMIIGLTGNIATGKSKVASIFEEHGASIIDADRIAREVVGKGSPAWYEIVRHFGEEILRSDGSIDRKALGEIVFRDREKMKVLNDITHPRIMEKIRRRIEDLEKQKADIVIIEAALIVEKGGMKDLIDKLVVVSCTEEEQLRRLTERDGIGHDEAVSRISSQMPSKEKLRHADYIIDNSGSPEHTRRQVKELLEKLRSGTI